MSQLDAAELDEDLVSVLQEQLLAVFKVLPTASLAFKPELRAALKTFLWWTSVRVTGQTFGQRMLDVQYSTKSAVGSNLTSRHKWTLLLLSVCLDWLIARAHVLNTISGLNLVPRRLEGLLDYLAAAVSTLSLLNFTVFLLRGSYPTLCDRLAGVHVAPSKPQVLRGLAFDLMNREIMWHGFAEFLFFILPHVNTFALRNWLRRVCLPPSPPPSNPSLCAVCEELPALTRTASCGHVYCYYCLQANCMADPNFTCSLCAQNIASQQQFFCGQKFRKCALIGNKVAL